jgi:hypothetical protein
MAEKIKVQRVQTGVRIEKRMLKVLKALAEVHDITLGDLLEAIVLHSFEGKSPFHDDGLEKIAVAWIMTQLPVTTLWKKMNKTWSE